MLTACVATGTQIREDMDKGVFDRFKVLPISRIAPLAGPMVADMIRYAIAATLTFATGIVMGYRPGGGVVGVFAAILLAIIAGWSLAWIFTWFGTVGQERPGGAGLLADGDVPADLPVQRVRPGRHPAAAGSRRSPRSTRSPTSSPRCATWPTTGTVTAEVGWALVGCLAVDRDLRAAVGAGLHPEDVTRTRSSSARASSTRSAAGRSAYSAGSSSRRPAPSRSASSASAAHAIDREAAVVGPPVRDHQQAYAVGVLGPRSRTRSAQAPTRGEQHAR